MTTREAARIINKIKCSTVTTLEEHEALTMAECVLFEQERMSDNREMIVLNGEQIDELVRCKDCKTQQTCNFAQYQGNNGFCSLAERKEGGRRMRLIDPKKIPKMGEPTTLEDAPMYEFAQCLIDYLVENYGVDVPNIVRCKDCKHKPTGSGANHDITFPDRDYRCPCRCEDFWYSWIPDDDWFCANGERRDDGTD